MNGLKELVTARYDPNTDTIEGCTVDSLAWHHENRHREQFHSSLLQHMLHGAHLILVGVSGAAIIGGLLHGHAREGVLIAGLATIPYLILVIGMEADAWMRSTYRYTVEECSRNSGEEENHERNTQPGT